jgi:nucleotide-binding universal stress UspA family protein
VNPASSANEVSAPAVEPVEVVLLPLDGSTFSLRAIPAAHHLARQLGARLELFSAVPSEDDVPRRQAELAEIDLPYVQAERTVIVDADAAAAIHRELRGLGRAVACLATHGRGRSAALVGSVATDVVARGHDPLVLVGRAYEPDRRGRGVVAWVDDSPDSAALLPVALTWGTRLRQPVMVGTVAEPVPEPVGGGPEHRLFGPDGDVKSFLEQLVEPFRATGHQLETVPVFDPIRPADGIRMYLLEHPAELSIVSSRARSGLSRIVFGSEAAHIVHSSPEPVLVVPRAVAG